MFISNTIETFIKVAELGSFHKASSALYLSPAGVMKQINSLEEELGFPLFERSRRGLTLTAGGESMLRDSQMLINYGEEAVSRARKLMSLDTNVIRIGASVLHSPDFLMKGYAEISKYCPELQYKLVPFGNDPHQTVRYTRHLGEEVDIVPVMCDKMFQQRFQVNTITTSFKQVCCAVSDKHPLASRKKMSIEDLAGQNILMMERGWVHAFDQLRDDLRQRVPDCNIHDFGYYDISTFNQCESGDVVMIALENWANVHPLLHFIPVDWKYSVAYGFMYPLNPSTAVQKFVNAWKQSFTEPTRSKKK